MINRILKRLGYHVCEEFTQWETLTADCSRPAVYPHDGMRGLDESGTIHYTRRWQERTCTICGRVQQRPLNPK